MWQAEPVLWREACCYLRSGRGMFWVAKSTLLIISGFNITPRLRLSTDIASPKRQSRPQVRRRTPHHVYL